MIVMAMAAVLMSVSFIACNPDDNSTEDLKGRWFTTTESLSELLIINDDNSVVTYRASNYESWVNVKGALTADGNELTIDFEDGNSVSGTFSVENNTLIINTTNGEYKYSKLANETNLVGEWNYSNIIFNSRAIKDEIVIPGGTINGVEVPPTVMQTSQLSSAFIDYAGKHYFRNIKFNESGTMTYDVLKDGSDLTLTKNYSIDGINMTITGETASHEIESSFMVLQEIDTNTAAFVFNKESVADMFIGYALMLFEGGIAPDVTNEALEAYKQAFTEAFDFYSVQFIITRTI